MSFERGKRREQMKRVKTRMRNLWTKVWGIDRKQPTGKWTGIMASTHGKPCSCSMCANRRGTEGLTLQELRVFHDRVEDLMQEESTYDIKREVEASECDNPLCDCH